MTSHDCPVCLSRLPPSAPLEPPLPGCLAGRFYVVVGGVVGGGADGRRQIALGVAATYGGAPAVGVVAFTVAEVAVTTKFIAGRARIFWAAS